MYECDTCTRTFASQHSCEQHMDALGHWQGPGIECDFCVQNFYNQDDCNEHMDDYGHHRWECDTCTRNFTSVGAKEQHMNAVGHWKHYCRPCKRKFDNDSNLRMHLNSRTHQGANVSCPFCKRAFTTASGVSHHLETGSCPDCPNANRETIFQALRQRDRNGIITNNLLEWHEDTWSVTNAWNGYRYECYLCHREFAGTGDLDKHLKSPVHMQNLYHCPNDRRCGVQFKTLGAMFNHLESESCGFMKFVAVQKNVGNVLTGNQRLIGFS